MKLVNLVFLLFIGTLGCQSQSTNAPHPIIATIQTGNLSQVEKFLEDHKYVNAHYAGYTLLCAAVKTNQNKSYLIL